MIYFAFIAGLGIGILILFLTMGYLADTNPSDELIGVAIQGLIFVVLCGIAGLLLFKGYFG